MFPEALIRSRRNEALIRSRRNASAYISPPVLTPPAALETAVCTSVSADDVARCDVLQEWLFARWKQEAIHSLVVYVVRMLLGVATRGALFSYVPEVRAPRIPEPSPLPQFTLSPACGPPLRTEGMRSPETAAKITCCPVTRAGSWPSA